MAHGRKDFAVLGGREDAMAKRSAAAKRWNSGYLFALFTVSVWGITFVSTKVLLVDFSPMEILFTRFVMGLAALWLLRPRTLKLASRRHEGLFILAGITGVLLYYLLENIALVFTTASNVSVIGATSPLFTALVASFLLRKRAFGSCFVAGFVLAMAGIALVSFQAEAGVFLAGAMGGGEWNQLFGVDQAAAQAVPAALEPRSAGAFVNLGDALVILAAFVWAVYSNVVKKISDLGYETIASTKRIFVWGVLCMAVIFPLVGGMNLDASLAFSPVAGGLERFLDPVNLSNLLFLGLLASAGCFVTWGSAVARIGATRTTVFIYLVPVITVTASVIVLGEPFTPQIAAGIVLVIAGLAISSK